MNNEMFKKLRLERGLTQEAIAKELGVTREAVSRWEAGVSSPRTESLPKLSQLLRCKIDELFLPIK